MSYLRIWHDNSGKGKYASWYLKHIIVHDLQTREKNYFLCEKWFAVEKGDFLIDRVLPVSCEDQKKQMAYLAVKQTKNKIRDGHLWFSIFFKPAQSTFTRIERVTVCFVLLYVSMLMNVMYYGMAAQSKTQGGLEIGPIIISIEQVMYLNKVYKYIY